MNKAMVAPYLRPPPNDPSVVAAVICASHSSGRALADGGVLRDWVRGMPIDVEASITVVSGSLLHSTGLTQGSRVVILLMATCIDSRWSCVLDRKELLLQRGGAEPDRFTLKGQVPAGAPSFSLDLAVQAVLREAAAGSSPLAAARPGDVLWELREVLELEGSMSQCPTRVLDFGSNPQLRPHRELPWVIRGHGELDAPFLSGRWMVIVNAAHGWYQALVSGSDRAVRQHLARDLGYALAATIVESDCDAEPATYEHGSVGWVLANFRKRKFPRLSTEDIRVRIAGADALERLLLAEVEQGPVR
jgi:hypothetical protein